MFRDARVALEEVAVACRDGKLQAWPLGRVRSTDFFRNPTVWRMNAPSPAWTAKPLALALHQSPAASPLGAASALVNQIAPDTVRRSSLMRLAFCCERKTG